MQVFPIRSISDVEFDAVNQSLTAVVEDHSGAVAELEVPFFSRSADAFSEFEKQLRDHGLLACFVSGHVQMSRGRLRIRPLAVIFQMGAEERIAASPWLGVSSSHADSGLRDTKNRSPIESSIQGFTTDLQTKTAETLLIGLQSQSPMPYHELAGSAERLGFARLPSTLKALGEELTLRSEQRNWKSNHAVQQFAQLIMLLRVME